MLLKLLGFVTVLALALVGYVIHRQTKLGQSDQDGGATSSGSPFALFLLIVLGLAFAFNYLYGLLGPWDPLGIYQRNRSYMGIYVN